MPQHMEVAADNEGNLFQWRAKMRKIIIVGVEEGLTRSGNHEVEVPTDEGEWVQIGVLEVPDIQEVGG